ncbi:MAG: nucleoside triphosphate pyrophosphohydrolase [Anaerolineales bacterium]
MKSMDALLSALGLEPLQGFTAISASQLAAAYFPPLNPDLGTLVLELDSSEVVERAWTVLRGQYSRDHRVVLLRDHNGPAQEISLEELDSETVALALYLPPMAALSSFESLQDTVAHLRAPEGCPWDREQTHQSLRKHMLEEAYEALEALDQANLDGLREELGDLLLQILMHAQIAQEQGNFRMSDVVAGIQAKLIRRHPHVFGDVEVADVEQVLSNWEHYKREETDAGPLEGVPRSLPALTQAAELQDRASRVGFAWPSIDEVMAKVKEEITELETENVQPMRVAELGDLLFAIVNYARWIKADPEAELQHANQRFRIRFSNLLQVVADQGRHLEQVELTELKQLWDDSKDAGV